MILQNYPVVAGFVVGLISSGGDLTAGIIGRLTGAALHFLGGVTFGIKGSLEDILGTSLAHRVVGGTSCLASGGSFLSGFLSSGTTQAFSPLIGEFKFEPIRVAIAAGIGGTASVLGGGTFENGAMRGLSHISSPMQRSELLNQLFSTAKVALHS